MVAADTTYASGSNYRDQGNALDVIGGELRVADDGVLTVAVQTLGTSEVATNITNAGLTTITASTTAPDYTLAAPVAGTQKIIACTANTSSGTAVISTNSTGVSLTSSGDNNVTFNSIKDRLMLIGSSTTAWIITSMMGSTDAGLTTSTQST